MQACELLPTQITVVHLFSHEEQELQTKLMEIVKGLFEAAVQFRRTETERQDRKGSWIGRRKSPSESMPEASALLFGYVVELQLLTKLQSFAPFLDHVKMIIRETDGTRCVAHAALSEQSKRAGAELASWRKEVKRVEHLKTRGELLIAEELKCRQQRIALMRDERLQELRLQGLLCWSQVLKWAKECTLSEKPQALTKRLLEPEGYAGLTPGCLLLERYEHGLRLLTPVSDLLADESELVAKANRYASERDRLYMERTKQNVQAFTEDVTEHLRKQTMETLVRMHSDEKLKGERQ